LLGELRPAKNPYINTTTKYFWAIAIGAKRMLEESSRLLKSASALSIQAGKTTQTLRLSNAEATHQFGIELGRSLHEGSILLLEGDLGSGKTTLVQGIGEGLGIVEPIISPTFTLINEYIHGRLPLYHLDLYRLEPADVKALNLESYWDEQETPLGIVAIEWPGRLPYLPDSYLKILLTHTSEGSRLVQWDAVGAIAPQGLGVTPKH